ILMLSQLGLFGSGCFGSGHLGNFGGVHFLTRRSGGFGHSIVARHAGTLTSGGVGHLSLHAGQPGGAPVGGHTFAHSGFLGSNGGVAPDAASAWGSAGSLGGSGISSLSASTAGPAVVSLKSTASRYLPASPRPTA